MQIETEYQTDSIAPAPIEGRGASLWNDSRLDSILASMGRMNQVGSTGIRSLDSILDGGLYPDVYILAAEPAAGKTTLALQIADYIASFGTRKVLFVSLEMSVPQMVAKSLSRTYSEQRDGILTFRDVIRMKQEKLDTIKEAVELYRVTTASNIATIDDKLTAQEIAALLESAINSNELPPVLFVDYLQIMPNADENRNATDYQHHTANMRAICTISKRFQIPVFVISAKNRAKRDSRSMDSLAGSSDIEYGASVVMFLSVDGKSEEERAANMEASERPVTLSVRKNRFGAYGDVPLTFIPAQNRFIERTNYGQESFTPSF